MNVTDGNSIKVKLILAAALIFMASELAIAENIRGRSRVVDGDTIIVRKTRIWLYGIDAPEYNQKCRVDDRPWSCGISAKAVLKQAIGTKRVTCSTKQIDNSKSSDNRGKVLAVCRVGKLNLNEWMVKKGWAIAFRRHGADYVAAEQSAKQKRRGVWIGTFIEPSEWRRQRAH